MAYPLVGNYARIVRRPACAHTGRCVQARIPTEVLMRAYHPFAHAHQPAVHYGRCAHVRIPATYAHTGRVYRPVRPCASTGRCGHTRIPSRYTRALQPVCSWRTSQPTTTILLLTYTTHTNVLPWACTETGFCTRTRGSGRDLASTRVQSATAIPVWVP